MLQEHFAPFYNNDSKNQLYDSLWSGKYCAVVFTNLCILSSQVCEDCNPGLIM